MYRKCEKRGEEKDSEIEKLRLGVKQRETEYRKKESVRD